MRALASLNLALRFLVAELGALAALALWAIDAFAGIAAALVAAGLVGLVAVVWALFVSPKADRRLRDPARFGLELVIFTVATAALLDAGYVVPAIVYAPLAVVTAALIRIWPEPV